MKPQPIRLARILANIRIKNSSAKRECPLTPTELPVRLHKFVLIVTCALVITYHSKDQHRCVLVLIL